ncbi:hypothetical protein PCANC_07072 [Puccinia coronata f. sp. avenae]|uniref:DUF6589 domain-containing protein n=1 Tax=Puccinia coronata f. sp. avenae TaxID=200324 RepID=A0A2N5U542_9BASI|nr:hypothetical protein PCASD_20865 [Puccinia coronata f. sp. avenae]PLW44528.1 hypothetical protein PCASD_11457 [Puccinia coronata f. sp. avenae]PLW55460.1 hypothetical protein PCANC_07072 [Puccinia coronata f. sp. avenae]
MSSNQTDPETQLLTAQETSGEEIVMEDTTIPSLSKDQKTINVCKEISSLPTKMTPKVFLLNFMESANSTLATWRRFWAQPCGITLTMDIVHALRNEINKTNVGQAAWSHFIQQESSSTVQDKFFSEEGMDRQQDIVVPKDMPFLYNTLLGMLKAQRGHTILPVDHEDAQLGKEDEELPEEANYAGYSKKASGLQQRFKRIASTVCCMMAFASNQRANALQLTNSVRFLACGVSERVHEYLNYLGLSSSRRTALSVMTRLGINAERKLKKAMRNQPLKMPPSICIDNLDMEQRVHEASVGHRSHTFRGTWGYVHLPNCDFVASLDQSELSLEAYQEAIQKLDKIVIEPSMFLPSSEAIKTTTEVCKSQIAQVLYKLAIPKDRVSAIPTEPTPVEKITPLKPEIYMMKLMDSSDNSAEGVGQVFESILHQSGLKVDEFFGRLQVMDGDLGTVQNFNCLRAQRAPNPYPKESLTNVLFQLGASHTLWNIALAIFSLHIGDPANSLDLGAWQYLEALGFPAEKAIQKKDFTLMVNQMEKILEAVLYYCLRSVMPKHIILNPDDPPTIKTTDWNAIVEDCYQKFCTGTARKEAKDQTCPKLYNTLMMLHNFSTVVEARRSMKAGDVGQLMIVWSKWCLMTQALPGITNYLSYLPRMVLLLTVILPPSMRKYLRHNLLISPTGRLHHFVAKDFWLEIQNYWLKYFYNRCGNGTQIERLRDMFSSNIMMLQKLLHSLKTDCGAEIIYQSHKNEISQRSLDMLIIMANNHDILDQYSKNTGKSKAPVDNTYLSGIMNLQAHIRSKDEGLKKFKNHLVLSHQPPNDPDNANNKNKSAADDESTNRSESSSGGSLDF